MAGRRNVMLSDFRWFQSRIGGLALAICLLGRRNLGELLNLLELK
jgi:hypothetical protein